MLLNFREIKLTLQIALPLMAAFIAQKGLHLIDTVMMGWIGPDALAAGILSMSIFGTALIFSLGTLSAIGIEISRVRGADQQDKVQITLQHGIYLALLLSIPCMILIWYTPNLLYLLGSDDALIAKSTELLHTLVFGFPGFLLFFVFREYIAAFNLTRIIMIVVVCALPLTYMANNIFIDGKYGLPAMGVVGIGLAGSIIMWLMFLTLYSYSHIDPVLKKYVKFKLLFDHRLMGLMLRVGIPTGFIFILDSGMFTVSTLMMTHFGVDALAAHSIAFQCASAAYAVPFALSMAVALQVGHAVGSKDMPRAKQAGYIGLFLGIILSGLIGLLLICMPTLFINLFLLNDSTRLKEIKELAIAFLTVAALFQCFDALQGIMNGALRGLKDTFIPLLQCVSCFWLLGIGSSYYLAFHTNLGAVGIWYGLTIGLLSAGIILFLRFRHSSMISKS